MQEAGATQVQELAFTIADGMEYVKYGVASGLDIDKFAGRLSFFFAIGMNFFMEVAKLRAARVLWHRVMMKLGAQDERSKMLRTHCQTSGVSCRSRTPTTTSSAPRSRRWRRCWAAPSRSTPMRWTKRSPCRPNSPPASRATRRS
jgi:hypothetical protein